MLKTILESFIRKTPAYSTIRWLADSRKMQKWKRDNCPVPPPQAYKHAEIRNYAQRYGLRVLVETGTFRGDTLFATRNDFDRLYSIELGEKLYLQAQKRFKSYPNVTILQGDSAKVLPSVLKELSGPALFWLDGHYSGGITADSAEKPPIEAELEAILAHDNKKHVILIDDARLFEGQPEGYPSISATREFILQRHPAASFDLAHDIIRVCLSPMTPKL